MSIYIYEDGTGECVARVDVLECQYICVDGTGECAVKVDGVDVNIYENGGSDGEEEE